MQKPTGALSTQSEMARLKSAKKKSAEKRIFFILPIDKHGLLWYTKDAGREPFLFHGPSFFKKVLTSPVFCGTIVMVEEKLFLFFFKKVLTNIAPCGTIEMVEEDLF